MAPLRTVMIGFGRVAAELAADPLMARWFPLASHLQCLQSSGDYQLVGIADASPDARGRAQRACPGIPTVATARELSDLRPDVAVLAMPPEGRLEVLLQCPTVRGMMLEKPLGPPAVRDPLLAFCAERRIATQVHYWRRGDPTMQSLAGGRLMERIGRPQAVFGLYGGGLRNNGSHLIDLVRMLLGPVRAVRATSDFTALSRPGLSGDSNLNFILELVTSAQVAVQSLDFASYREVGLDIWAQTGRLAILQEGLHVAIYPAADHRGLMDAREIVSDRPALLPVGSAEATPNLYANLARALNHGDPLMSSLASAVETETIIDALTESAGTGARIAVPEAAS